MFRVTAGVADPIAVRPHDEAYADAVRRHRRTRNSRVSRVREPSKSDSKRCSKCNLRVNISAARGISEARRLSTVHEALLRKRSL